MFGRSRCTSRPQRASNARRRVPACALCWALTWGSTRSRWRSLQGAFGRPELASAHDPHDLCFNLSHTAGLAVFAIGRRRSIGIDVEAVDRRAPSPGVIERALRPREAERVLRADGRERTAAFLHYWTVKEAYAKALGVGLALDLREVGVDGPPSRPRLDLPGGPGEWRVRRLRPRTGFVGAVVADGEPWRMRLRELRLS